MSYSPEMIAELSEGTWDYAKATAFATKHMQKPRSVVAKLIALGTPYQAATSTKATTQKKESKAELVARVEALLGTKITTLEKVNMDDLRVLEAAIEALR